jgi:hypothetical protein
MIKYIIMGKSGTKTEGQEDHNKTLVVKERARALTAVEFHRLAEVPPAIEWFGNIRNEKATGHSARNIEECLPRCTQNNHKSILRRADRPKRQ